VTSPSSARWWADLLRAVLSTDISGLGTPEQQWQAWPELQRWPLLQITPPPALAVVVAPHPDDEVLGVGGTLSRLARSGTRVHVIAVTDGEASHPKSPTLSSRELATRRIAESADALHALRLGKASVERLGQPDGGVREMERRSAGITAAVIRALARHEHLGPAWCFAPWPGDGHPDHAAAGIAAIAGASGVARVLTYPVWMWHWATPRDPRVPWSQARRIELPAEIHDAKRAAVQCFRTQVAPLSHDPADAAILPPEVLSRLTRRAEVVFDGGPA
jgi:LmbE family N-acetylglucosaminyl deacetylase